MKIEEQVVSLELAKELKEVGYGQEGVWWWFKSYLGHFELGLKSDNKFVDARYRCVAVESKETYVTPTVAELGRAVPYCFEVKGRGICWLDMSKDDDCWWISYRVGCAKAEIQQKGSTEANARAKCWLHLNKQGLL